MIDARPEQMAEIRAILEEYVPGWEVRALGSRVKGSAKPWSDLDLAVAGPSPMSWQNVELLIEAFQESTLPFRVDVLDWREVSPAFQAIITEHYAVIQAGQSAGVSP